MGEPLLLDIEDIFIGPMNAWHSNGKVDEAHHKIITEITEKLEDQAQKMRELLEGLKIDES